MKAIVCTSVGPEGLQLRDKEKPAPRDTEVLVRVHAELLATGTLVPVIDRCYPLGDAPAAITYLMKGHARGKVVLTVSNEAS